MWQDIHDRIQARSRVADNGCWLWNLSHGTRGYGQVTFLGTQYGSHRLMLCAKLRRWLEPHESACHTCDVPSCVNPAHLFVGTQADNLRDASAKGRLTKHNRDAMLHLLAKGWSKAAVARELGCDVRTVFRVAKLGMVDANTPSHCARPYALAL